MMKNEENREICSPEEILKAMNILHDWVTKKWITNAQYQKALKAGLLELGAAYRAEAAKALENEEAK